MHYTHLLPLFRCSFLAEHPSAYLAIGVSASLSARLSRKDGQGPTETPRSGPNLSMTRHKESMAHELQKADTD